MVAYSDMSGLRLSKNTKTSPVVRDRIDSRAFAYPEFPNSFGLPAGATCPGQTGFCDVCYGVNAEGRTGVRNNLYSNLDELRGRSEIEMTELLREMMGDYRQAFDKAGLPSEHDIFRIHWDGDFFSGDYARAWRTVILGNPDTSFWTYTRSFGGPVDVVDILAGIPNLAFYLSVDAENIDAAMRIVKERQELKKPRIFLAFCAQDQYEAESLGLQAGKSLAALTVCPENAGTLPLASDGKGACVNCLLCIKRRPNILFVNKPKSIPRESLFGVETMVELTGRRRKRQPSTFDLSLLGVEQPA